MKLSTSLSNSWKWEFQTTKMLDNAKYHARTNKIRTSGNGQCEVLGRNREVLKFSKGLSAPRPMWNIFTLCCWKHYWRWELEVRAGRIRMQNAAVVLDLYFWTSRVIFNINFQFVLLVESSCNKNTFVNSIIHSVLKNNNSALTLWMDWMIKWKDRI